MRRLAWSDRWPKASKAASMSKYCRPTPATSFSQWLRSPFWSTCAGVASVSSESAKR